MSNEVKRYDPEELPREGHFARCAEMEESPDGSYVHHDDYAALEAKCEQQNDLLLYAHERFSEVIEERDALRAELEAARKQEPAQYQYLSRGDAARWWNIQQSDVQQAESEGFEVRKLYALPPLAGQVSVPRELLERLLNALDKGFPCIRVADELRALIATPSMEVKHGA